MDKTKNNQRVEIEALMSTDDIQLLTFEGKEIHLIGTAHISRESADLVGQFINQKKPDTVCLELCESRYQSLTQESRWQNTNLFKVIREKKAFLLLSNLMLAYFQKRIGQKLGIKPGEEMMRAIESAATAGATIHLVDRDIRTTLSRIWRLMGFWAKMKMLAQILASGGELDAISKEDIENMKKKDVLETLISEIGEELPDVKRILIDERDQYLAHEIRTSPGRNVVAVVGAGHVPGINSYWNLPVDIDALKRVPPKSKLWSSVKWLIPLLIIGLVVFGFSTAGPAKGTHMLKWWILANGVLAGLGAAIALGHPLTILSAVIASPLTSLNPMIAAGWVSGLVEAFLGKPRVRDFESLPEIEDMPEEALHVAGRA